MYDALMFVKVIEDDSAEFTSLHHSDDEDGIIH